MKLAALLPVADFACLAGLATSLTLSTLSTRAFAAAPHAKPPAPTTSVVPVGDAAPADSTSLASLASPISAASHIDASAMALLKKVQETMLAATSYYAECWTTQVFYPVDGRTSPTRHEMATLTEEKPNLMRYDCWEMDVDAKGKWSKHQSMWSKQKRVPTSTFVCDGETNWAQEGATYRTDNHTTPDTLDYRSESWAGFYSFLTLNYVLPPVLWSTLRVGLTLRFCGLRSLPFLAPRVDLPAILA